LREGRAEHMVGFVEGLLRNGKVSGEVAPHADEL
jgi:hypothetical protein